MKKYVISIILFIAMAALVCVSCGSTPTPSESAAPVVEPTTRPPSQTPPSTDALTGPRARANEARQRAVDFEGPAYFPSDWENVETQYASAGSMSLSTENGIRQAAESYNTAADAYDGIFERTIPLYAQAREDEVMSARDELIGTGFTAEFPEYLQNADEIALTALDQYDAGDYYAARDTAAEALDEYETLMTGARVFVTRQEIINRGFREYDAENFARADEITIRAINEYEAGNKETAVSNAEEAQLRYNHVLANGWTSYASDRHTSAVSERELALADRANIASRETFREAEALYQRAEESLASENFQEAASLYTDSEALFVISRYETEEKRQRALEVIRIAEERIEESSETAIEAERIIEGGSR